MPQRLPAPKLQSSTATQTKGDLRVRVPKAHLDNAFAYVIDRGNGVYTRLIPADQLPAIAGIPKYQDQLTNLIILPEPRQTEKNTPANGQFKLIGEVRSGVKNVVGGDAPRVLTDGGNSKVALNRSTKPEKVYCSKWVFTGTCAFTQQGCKYRHEMPTDPDTLRELGFENGEQPKWWKKREKGLEREKTTRSRQQDANRSHGQEGDSSTTSSASQSNKKSSRHKTRVEKRRDAREQREQKAGEKGVAKANKIIKLQEQAPETSISDKSEPSDDFDKLSLTDHSVTSEVTMANDDDEQDLNWWRREKENSEFIDETPVRNLGPIMPPGSSRHILYSRV